MLAMQFDLHIHTRRYSGCSGIDPEELLQRAREVGLDGIALTEHGIRWPDAALAALAETGAAGGLLVIPGQEVACYSRQGRFQGEFLVFGYPTSLGSAHPVETVIERVHAVHGVVLAAHPFKRSKNGAGWYGSGWDTRRLAVDGLEIAHPAYDEEGRAAALTVMRAMGVAGIGASDAHDLRDVGRCRTVFERPVDGGEALCREIRAGRLRAVADAER